MTTDFRLVTDASEGHANKFTIGRASHRFSQRRLANAWRADKTQNRPFYLADSLLDCEVFKNAIFHLVEAEMIFVKNTAARFKSCLTLLRLPKER